MNFAVTYKLQTKKFYKICTWSDDFKIPGLSLDAVLDFAVLESCLDWLLTGGQCYNTFSSSS
jgi:hypothetical protein